MDVIIGETSGFLVRSCAPNR